MNGYLLRKGKLWRFNDMQVKEISGMFMDPKKKDLTIEDINREYNYWRSVKILTEMLQKGIITQEEFLKIDLLNRKSFSPSFASLMP